MVSLIAYYYTMGLLFMQKQLILARLNFQLYNSYIMKIFKQHHPRRHAKSFKYAFSGLFHTMINEPNFRIQLIIVAAFIYLGFKYRINNLEWAILTISMGLLLSAEMVNTVVENFLDAFMPEKNDGARLVKDISAGFVLITAITTLIVFILIFGDNFRYLAV